MEINGFNFSKSGKEVLEIIISIDIELIVLK